VTLPTSTLPGRAFDTSRTGGGRESRHRHGSAVHFPRRLFLFSIIYLPRLWGALVIDQHWV
jgi:hypothetical protein